MISELLYFLAFLACLFVTKKLKDISVNKSLIEVYRAMKEEDEELFIKALQQKGLKVFISTFTTQFLKLKFYVCCDNYEKVQAVLNEIKVKSLKFKDRIAVNQLMFSYSVEKNNYEQIQYYYNLLLKDLIQKEDLQFQQLLNEIKLVYSIFIKEDCSLITNLESRIAASKEAASLAVLYYYKARLYYAKSNVSQCRKDLVKSIQVSNNEKWKAKIENILNSGLSQFN